MSVPSLSKSSESKSDWSEHEAHEAHLFVLPTRSESELYNWPSWPEPSSEPALPWAFGPRESVDLGEKCDWRESSWTDPESSWADPSAEKWEVSKELKEMWEKQYKDQITEYEEKKKKFEWTWAQPQATPPQPTPGEIQDQPMFIEPNYFHSNKELSELLEIAEQICEALKADFVYHEEQHSYRCSAYNLHAEVHFWINFFKAKDVAKGRYLIEIQKMSGDGFGFIDVVRGTRAVLKHFGITKDGDSAPEGPFPNIQALSLDLKGITELPQQFVPEEIEEATLRNVLSMAHSPYSDVQSEALTALACMTEGTRVAEKLAENPHQVTSLVPFLKSGHVTVHRCTAVIFANLLNNPKTGPIFQPFSGFFIPKLCDLIKSCPVVLSTTPQVLRECARCLLMLAKANNPYLGTMSEISFDQRAVEILEQHTSPEIAGAGRVIRALLSPL